MTTSTRFLLRLLAVLLQLAVVMQARSDDSAAIQKLLNSPDAFGQVRLPAGTYEFGPLTVPATVRYIRGEMSGDEHLTILRLAPNSGEWARMLNVAWSLDRDMPLTIVDLKFDLNRNDQGWEGGFDLAHQAAIILGADKLKPGKIKATFRNLVMSNGAGDGVYQGHGVELDMARCAFGDIFRAALAITGKASKSNVRHCLFERSGIDVEPNSDGDNVDVTLDSIVTHDFDISLTDKSRCRATNIKTTGGVLYLRCHPGAEFVAEDCDFLGYFKIRLPGQSRFTRCNFTGQTIGFGQVIGIQWAHGSLKSNQKLTFEDGTIRGPGKLGIAAGEDEPVNGNQLSILTTAITGTAGGAEAAKTATGREKRGKPWILTGSTHDGVPLK